MDRDYYRPPRTDEERAALLTPTGAPLYQTRHIAIASLFGSPAGGLLLIALNEQRLGRITRAIVALLLGLGALCGVVALLPSFSFEREHEMLLIWPIVWIVGPVMYAEHTQGIPVRVQVSAGVPLGSPWRAAFFGTAIGAVVAVLAVAFATWVGLPEQ